MKAASPKEKVGETIARPRNQHGVNLDPHKAKSSLEFLPMLEDELLHAFRNFEVTDYWPDVASSLIDASEGLSDEEKQDLISFVSRATDEDLLFVYLHSCFA